MNQRPDHFAFENKTAIVDIFPTIASFLNIKLPAAVAKELDGVSLWSHK
jgi:hypothetical protein